MNFDAKEIKRLANGRWRDILSSLAHVPDHSLRNVNQPCPNCAGNDRFRFDNKNGDGTWYCNQCGGNNGRGGGGDGFMLLMRMNGWSFNESVNNTATWLNAPDGNYENLPRYKTPIREKQEEEPDEFEQITPVPEELIEFVSQDEFKIWNPKKHNPDGSFGRFSNMRPKHVAIVRNTKKEIQGFVIRIETDTKKIPFQAILGLNKSTGEQMLVMHKMTSPRSLYGVEKTVESKKVIILLGEKKTDIVQKCFTIPCVSIIGGDGSVVSMDWAPLHGKDILILPDNDESGWNAAQRISVLLADFCHNIKIVRPPFEKAKGWDFADAIEEGWTKEDLKNYIVACQELPGEPFVQDKEIESSEVYEIGQDEKSDFIEEKNDSGIFSIFKDYIRFLGYNHEVNYYYSYERKQIISLSSSAHTKSNLILLAPEINWITAFPAEDSKGNVSRNKWSLDSALDWLNRLSVEHGHYDPKNIRKSGCWWDTDKVVMHLGSHLLVNGAKVELQDFGTQFIYEARPAIGYKKTDLLTKEEALFIESTAKKIRWKNAHSAYLSLGWIVLAPICGLLSWRPHIWITGGTGTGKSTIVSDFIKPLLGGMSITPNGSSTEAGIRQSLSGDALPVIIDEAEGNDANGRDKIQKLLELARASSCDSSSVITRGSASGESMDFVVKSMFAFSAIQEGIKLAADRNRIVTMELKAWSYQDGSMDLKQKSWHDLENCLALINDSLGMKLITRSISMLPIIQENIEIFKSVLATKLGSQRLGDTYGALMAGWYSLISDDSIGENQAIAVCDQIAWDNFTEESLGVEESDECMSAIMQTQIRYDIAGKGQTSTIGELVERMIATFDPFHKFSTADEDARQALGRHGIRVDKDFILVANKSVNLEKVLKDSIFGVNWHRYLSRIDKAEKRNTINFGGGLRSRCVAVPMDSVSFDVARFTKEEDFY